MVAIANNLARRNFPTQLVIIKPELTYQAELDSAVELVNLNTHRIWRSVLPLARYLQRERPAVLMATLVEANMAAVLARRIARVPCRLVIREASTPSQALVRSRSWKKRIAGVLLPRLYRYADTVIAVSEGMYRDLTEVMRVPPHKVCLIRNPVPFSAIRQQMLAPLSHPWFESPKIPVVLSVGNLRRPKDYPTLLQAFALVRQAVDARLVILGEGAERPALEQLIDELRLRDVVMLPGFDPNPFRYMRRANLFVLSSRYEGFPNVLVQALACGCPVVSTDCQSGPRDILDDGRYGLLVPVGDAAQLAHAIVQALHTPPPLPPHEWLDQFDETRVTEQLIQTLFPQEEQLCR